MVHPCIPDFEDSGDELHACHSTSSTKTLCKKKSITADDVDRTDGATKLCRDCYPNDRTPTGTSKEVDVGRG